MDELSLSRLTVARLLFDQGERHALTDGIAERMLAVITFDLAVETLLKTVLVYLVPTQHTEKLNFPDLVDKCHAALANAAHAGILGREHILRMRRLSGL
jgi:hypothetical protein